MNGDVTLDELAKSWREDDADDALLDRLRRLRSDPGTGFDEAMTQLEARIFDLKAQANPFDSRYRRGLRDGIHGDAPAEASGDYLQGFVEGKKKRLGLRVGE